MFWNSQFEKKGYKPIIIIILHLALKKKSGLLIALCKGKAIKNTHIMIALLKETLLNTAWILFNRPLWQHYNDTTIALTRNAIKNQAFNSTLKVLLKRMHLQ